MERLLRALDRRFGKFPLPNVAALLIAPKVAFFLWVWWEGQGDRSEAYALLAKLAFVPKLVLDGEAWRVVTFFFAPPTTSIPLFLLYCYVLFLYVSGLQARWGQVRLYAYILTGWLAVVATSFLAMLLDRWVVAPYGFVGVEATLLLAFATFYPNFTFMLFFVLPVKAKWLAWFAAAGGALAFAEGSWSDPAAYAGRIVILGAFANYLLFFGPALWRRYGDHRATVDRRRQFEDGVRRGYEERDRLAAEERETESRDREEVDR